MLPTMSRRGTRDSRRGTVLTAALLCVAVGAGTLAGCSSNNEPEPLSQDQPDKKQEPAPEPEPTEDQTSDGPELPDKLDEPYVAVVLNYFDAWHKALDTGNTDSFMKYATKDCEGCRNMAGLIEDAFANGGTLEIEKFEPVLDSDRNLARQGSDTNATVILHYDEGKSTIVPEQGADPEEHPARFTDQQATMVREGNEWKIDELHVETVQE